MCAYREITSVIFDMGCTLLDFDPDRMIRTYFDEEKCDLIYKTVFLSGDWIRLDEGSLQKEEAVEKWKKCLTIDMHEALCEMMRSWYQTLIPIDGIYDLVSVLKSNGYKCYILSNASADFMEYKDVFKEISIMDGYIVSALHKKLKPSEDIYRILLETFSLLPEECFFVDDRRENVEAAGKMGIRGHMFQKDDISALVADMRAVNINI